ncbi:MAG: pseudouridine-5'-phosphate glycosidase [Fimbriimonadales bacterium]
MKVQIPFSARVALETAVVTHGLPKPHNRLCATQMSEAVRSEGAEPAVIGYIDGRAIIGLSEAELDWLAEYPAPAKIALHNMGIASAMKMTGGTTVSATAWLAHRAGIVVVATGGIGGVHRGELNDVSADLPTLAQTPVLVVCSGAKVILDLPNTREWLETWGIPVIGFGTDELPGFYTPRTGLRVDVQVGTVEAVVELWEAHQPLGRAMLVVQPPPANEAIPPDEMDAMLRRALQECEQAGVRGSAVTPWLLERLSTLSEGRTLAVNLALLEANARLAGKIAKALSDGV